MTVTVTVYLKNGMNVSLDVPDTTLEDQRVLYSEAFKKERKSLLSIMLGRVQLS